MMRLSAVSLSTCSAGVPVIAIDRKPTAARPQVRDARMLHALCPGMRPMDRRGMTLIEVLIATALTLLIMLALAQGFKTMSEGVTAGRARLTGSDQLRSLSGLLRSDLNGLTVNTNTLPQSYQSANGYFMYYDGPISDSTAMLFNYAPLGAEIEDRISASRWSDIDDVLMFTAKARDGEWFRGRVPLALLKIHQFNTTGSSSAIVEDDYFTDVTVASEYAEVAWFMRPLNDLGSIDIAESGNSGYGTIPPSNPVLDAAPVADRTGDGVPDSDGMPDRIALCRRVLLIRPDLNITPPSSMTIPSDPQVAVRPLPVAVGS
ncbi:MAG: type II secretion system protein J, partial [Pirellula sp.]